ncbi:MAG: ribonucleoside triphosphate reductase [Candidatus Asgardarchaeia archaeon]
MKTICVKNTFLDSKSLVEQYLYRKDWRVRENSNMTYSLQGLNNYLSASVISNFWLSSVYPKEASKAHIAGDFHIHDLDVLGPYCVGWDLADLLTVGFTGVPGKIESRPAKHFRVILGQIVNFFYTLQGESAGAQAFANVDTYVAPFIRYDHLSYEEVVQAVQEFLYNMNVPTRVGFQTPFTNITLDLKVPKYMENEQVIIGGKRQKDTYGDFQDEIDLFNAAFAEVMTQGDAKGRPFSFPIPTYNLTRDFDWDNPVHSKIWEMTAKFGIPYFANFINSDMRPEDTRSMCCHLRLDNRELKKRGGGLFGANPLTGSIGVVTINMPRIGYLSRDDDEFLERIDKLMTLAKEALEVKRQFIEKMTENGLYPYSRFYLRNIKALYGQYWINHFSTIGLVGMNEALLNFMGVDIGSREGIKFALGVLDFMRERLSDFQEETGHLYNLEATPAEGTSYRLAKIDKEQYPTIIVANEQRVQSENAAPYYTNSTHLPVGYSDDIFEVLELQDELQTKYTGGTVLHIYLGEHHPSPEAIKLLVKRVATNFRLPYFTVTPTFSICPIHGYIPGEHEFCPICDAELGIKNDMESDISAYTHIASPSKEEHTGEHPSRKVSFFFTKPH